MLIKYKVKSGSGWNSPVGYYRLGQSYPRGAVRQYYPFRQRISVSITQAVVQRQVAVNQSLSTIKQSSTTKAIIQTDINQQLSSFSQTSSANIIVQAGINQSISSISQTSLANVIVQTGIDQSLLVITQSLTGAHALVSTTPKTWTLEAREKTWTL